MCVREPRLYVLTCIWKNMEGGRRQFPATRHVMQHYRPASITRAASSLSSKPLLPLPGCRCGEGRALGPWWPSRFSRKKLVFSIIHDAKVLQWITIQDSPFHDALRVTRSLTASNIKTLQKTINDTMSGGS